MLKAYPYQLEGVEFLLGDRSSFSRRACLLADEQGLGKTIQVVLARNEVIQSGETTLIICPASVKYNWKVELEDNAIDRPRIQIIGSYTDVIDEDTDVLIVNYEFLRNPKPPKKKLEDKEFNKAKFKRDRAIKDRIKAFNADYVVIDEAHYLAHGKALRTNNLLNGQHGILASRSFRYVWLLTGTPMTNRPIDMYPVLRAFASKLLGPYADYRRYALRYCGARYNDYSSNATKGASNLEELHKRIAPFYLRREKKDVLPDLPDKIVNTVYFEPNQNVKNLENDINTYRQFLEDGKDLGQTSTLRREVSLEKVKIIKSYIEAIDQPTILFYHHRTVGDELQKIHPDAIRIDGHTKNKQEKIEAYKKKKGILLAQIGSVGTGVNGLQHACSRAIFVELPWAPGALGQAIDRLHRIGQKDDVIVELLILHKCLDENIYKSLKRKQRNIEQVIVAIAKKEEEKLMTIEAKLDRIIELLEGGNAKTANTVSIGTPKEVAAKPAPAKAVAKAAPKAAAKPAAPKLDYAALKETTKELAKKFMTEFQDAGYGTKEDAQVMVKTKIFPDGKNTTTCSAVELQTLIEIFNSGSVDDIVAQYSEDTAGDDDEL